MSRRRPRKAPASTAIPGLLWPTVAAFSIAAVMAVFARGLAGDEEAAHYLIARYAPQSPDLFISLVGRPLVTLLLTLPAQAGFLATRLAGALATAATAYAVARVVRRTGWVHPLWAVGLLLIQPFYLAHAGTAMTEPWTAALVAAAILAYVERRLFLLTLAVALMPLARIEAMVFWPLVVWTLIRERGLRHLWLLALPLPLWNLGGWLVSGDPLWLLHQTNVQSYPQRSPFHYVVSLGWILGAGLGAPVMLGMVQAVRSYVGRSGGEGRDAVPAADHRRTLVVSASILAGCLLIYTALAWWRPITYGNLRYFAFAAPAIALLSAAGIRALLEQRKLWGWIALGGAVAAAFGLWSHPLLGDFTVLDRRDYFFGLVTLPWIALYLLPIRLRTVAPLVALLLGAFGLLRNNAGTLHITPTAEHEAVRGAASLLADGVVGRVPIYSAHPLLAFYAGGNLYDPAVYPPVTEQTSTRARPGSLIFWESHYVITRGPSLTMGSFLGSPEWTYLGGTLARDSTWVGAFFQRGAGGGVEGGPSPLSRTGLDREAWIPLAQLAQSGVPMARVATREDPRDPDRWLDLATLLNAAGQGREALAAHQRAVDLNPHNPRNHAVRGDALRRAGRLEEAYSSITQALTGDPDNGDYHLTAARILMRTERPADARPHMIQAADRLSKRWEVQYMAGRYHFQQGEWPVAERRLVDATRLNPRHVEAATFAARAQVAQGKWGEAETTLRELTRRRPRSPDGYRELGDLLYALERDAEAMRAWKAGLSASSNDEGLAHRVSTGAPPAP